MDKEDKWTSSNHIDNNEEPLLKKHSHSKILFKISKLHLASILVYLSAFLTMAVIDQVPGIGHHDEFKVILSVFGVSYLLAVFAGFLAFKGKKTDIEAHRPIFATLFKTSLIATLIGPLLSFVAILLLLGLGIAGTSDEKTGGVILFFIFMWLTPIWVGLRWFFTQEDIKHLASKDS